MLRYTLRRILLLIPVLIGVVVIIFTINYVTGADQQVIAFLLSSTASPEDVASKLHELGLDRPYLVQLGDYFWQIIAHGSFGTSYVLHKPVAELIGQRIWITVRLGLGAAFLSTIIGIPIGILAAVKQNSIFDYICTFFATMCSALPSFWLCLMFILFFSVKLGWFPITGIKTWKGYVLPIVASGIFPIAMLVRMTRASMLEVIRQDYIRTARAKGVPERRVIWKHALQNALVPVVTLIGTNIGASLTGSVLAETIFNIPGLGLLMQNSLSKYDTITEMGCILLCAFIMSVMNLLTDLFYAVIDPRIHAQYEGTGKGNRVTAKKQTLAEGGKSDG